jgi:hypothetical protein
MSNLLRIDRLELLTFFDTRPQGSIGHANAINAVAGEDLGSGLLKHYLENIEGTRVTISDEPCTPQTRKGKRLDRWISVKWPDRIVLFQTEIKNWSAHSLGGKNLPLDATAEHMAQYKKECWSKEWHAEEQRLLKEPTCKVLMPMKTSRTGTIEPALCMWVAMHPEGKEQPWFSVALPEGECFPRLWVFSMSAYLRTLTDRYIEIEMPETVQRLRWLNRLFTSPSP